MMKIADFQPPAGGARRGRRRSELSGSVAMAGIRLSCLLSVKVCC
jgi:hypothetical protein